MFRQLFKSLVLARQASATLQVMRYISDNQLADIGFTRSNYVEGMKAQILEELNAEDANATMQHQYVPTCKYLCNSEGYLNYSIILKFFYPLQLIHK